MVVILKKLFTLLLLFTLNTYWYNLGAMQPKEVSEASFQATKTLAYLSFKLITQDTKQQAQDIVRQAFDKTEVIINNSESKRQWYGAFLEDRMVGVTRVWINGRHNNLTQIEYLVVDKDFRKQKIGTAIIEFVKPMAGTGLLFLYASELATKDFYKKCGFSQSSTFSGEMTWRKK